LPMNDPLVRYVDRVGQLIALGAEANGEGVIADRADPEDSAPNRPWPLSGYHFIVVDSVNANAFGGPGGVVIITTGMIAKLKDEEELAGVLAHEVVHVKRGHGVEAMKAFICKQDKKTETQAQIKEATTKAASALPGEVLRDADPKKVGEFFEKVADGAMGVFTAGYPEEYELEADRTACRYMVKAGYHPWAVLNVLQRLKAESNGQDQYMQNHPPFDERIDAVKPVLSSLPAAELQISKDDIALRAQRFKAQTAKLQPKS
jgi:predicted Zn-dependent protease